MKEMIFKASRIGIFVAAVGQLAVSQIHIGIITKVFEPSIGFFLFLFVTFGVVLAFNSSSMRNDTGAFIGSLFCIAAAVMGVIYLNILISDVRAGNVLTMEDATVSVLITIVVISTYVIGTVLMLFNRKYDA